MQKMYHCSQLGQYFSYRSYCIQSSFSSTVLPVSCAGHRILLIKSLRKTDFIKPSLASSHLRLHEALCVQERGHSEVSMPSTPQSLIPHCTSEWMLAINTRNVRDAFAEELQRETGAREEGEFVKKSKERWLISAGQSNAAAWLLQWEWLA